MNKLSYITLLFLSFISSGYANNFTQVFIEGDDIGQGFLVKRLNLCYFISPLHVIENSVFLTVKGSDELRSLGDGQMLQPFGYDLSVGHVSGSLANQCGVDYNAISVKQSDIEKAKSVIVSTVNSDGLPSNMSATIQETGLIYLTIKPQAKERTFFKGMSGSLVFSGGVPVGMLQSIDNKTGLGKVLRMDRLFETVSPFFSTDGGDTQVNEVAPTKGSNLNFIVTYWNMPPTVSQKSIKLINDGDTSTYYETTLNGDIAEIDFTLSDYNHIEGLKLSLPNDSGIKDIEVLTSKKSEGKRGWISTASSTILPNQSEVVIELGSIKARRLKVKFYSSWNKNGLIKISEATIF
ncbi:hypothetical protein [Alteromonas abrolhosensis]|uniref:hypothetical protein n=1 Tax=Alteromonas abrolhosensis TaxID=1892904 RepID=UPI00096BC709|nr:hypothetical protein [Alteromonas abrolhosensis]|tara:strand:+ start:2027 stop:3076 length:1050 start_codon:yes stop_codon:yes gene_type:complete